ncbi:MAG: hypothetical protein ACHP8B_13385 [Terriglobales bacterium]
MKVSVLAGAAAIFVCRGAERIYVPVPDTETRDRATEGIAKLPSERQGLVSLIDSDGDVLARVIEYLRPLGLQARKWPEDAFAGFLVDFLYEVALASKYKTPIASSSIQVVREFVPIIDPREFRGEARFRLAECISLICDYDVDLIEHGNLRVDTPSCAPRSPDIWRFLDFAEFRELVAATGALGFLEIPFVGLRRLRYAISEFLQRADTKPILSTAGIVADLAGVKQGEKIGKLAENLGVLRVEHFSPAFIPLGPVELGLYKSALAEVSPEAKPPEGSILVFEKRGAPSWLNVGDELKLEREAADLAGTKEDVVAARAAISRFY